MKACFRIGLRLAFVLPLLGGSMDALLGCKGKSGANRARSAGPRQSGPVPVKVAKVESRRVAWRKVYVGRVVALKEQLLRPEGDGPIARVLVREGQFVRAGQALVAMDPVPAQQALARADANLSRANSQAQLAKQQALRFSQLLAQGYVSRAEAETLESASRVGAAEWKAAQAERHLASRALARTTLRAPFAGVVQELRAVPGAWAKPSDEALLRLVDTQALELRAAVPQSEWLELRAAGHRLQASARMRGQVGPWLQGQYLGLDAALDGQSLSAMARVRLMGKALPVGGFAEMQLELPVGPSPLVLPSQAIQQGQQGLFVYVKQDDVASMHPVRVLRESDGWTALSQGPAVGSEVVVDGFARLAPGVKIQVLEGDALLMPPREGGPGPTQGRRP